MDEHITYWGSAINEAVIRDMVASHPIWELGLFGLGLLAAVLFALFGLVLTFRVAVRRLRHLSPKSKRYVWVGVVVLLVYIGLYFCTTEVRPQGQGGLTGPLRVRVFPNEKHLIVFYPLYLVERWIRNGSLDSAVYYFNVEFKDGLYPHPWLYRDGAYGEFW